MKRNLEFVRDLLLMIEEKNTTDSFFLRANEEDPYTNEEMQYHLLLMYDAGLIDGRDCSTSDGPDFLIHGMTWHGHDFLDAARDQTIWNAASEQAESKGVELKGLPFEIAKELLFEAAKKMFFS